MTVLIEHWADILVSLILVAVVGLIIRNQFFKKTAGGCSGCAGCSGCSGCGQASACTKCGPAKAVKSASTRRSCH